MFFLFAIFLIKLKVVCGMQNKLVNIPVGFHDLYFNICINHIVILAAVENASIIWKWYYYKFVTMHLGHFDFKTVTTVFL